MNSISAIFKDKSLWLSTISIVLLFIIIPKVIFSNTYIAGIGLMILIVYTTAFDKKGFTCIIFCFSLMMPYGIIEMNTGFPRYITYICVCLAWIILFFFKSKKVEINFIYIGALMLFLFLISSIYFLNNGFIAEVRDMLFYIISTAMFFYICFLDKLTLKDFFNLLDVIFYFSLFYVIQDSVFDSSPYRTLYLNLDLDFQLRAKGLMGHPLLLSSFIAFYQISLIIKGIVFGKWNLFNILLILPIVVLSASKTLIVLMIVSWFFYLLLAKAYKNGKFYFGILIMVALALQVFPFLKIFTDVYFQRIFDSTADQRFGSYSIAGQIFWNNPLGIGITGESLKSELGRVGYIFNSSYDKSFLIFDNAYLTAAASLGIMGFTLFIIYIFPLRLLKKYAFDEDVKPYRNSLLILFVIWFLQNLSFDSFQYFPVNAFYFILSACVIKEFIAVSKDKKIKEMLLIKEGL